MYTLTTQSEFDGAHFLHGYDGKCANIHGHRWTVSVEVGSEKLTEKGTVRGMIVDFSKLKSDLREETEYLDHSLIIEKGSLKETTLRALKEESFRIIELDFRPTAENLAKYFYDKMKEKGYENIKATVYETPNNKASYSEKWV